MRLVLASPMGKHRVGVIERIVGGFVRGRAVGGGFVGLVVVGIVVLFGVDTVVASVAAPVVSSAEAFGGVLYERLPVRAEVLPRARRGTLRNSQDCSWGDGR